MKYLIVALAFVSLTFSAADTAAEDRRGFVSGLSLGVAPVTKFSIGQFHESGTALIVDALGAYCWDDRNLILARMNISVRNSDYFTEMGRGVTHLDGSPLGDQHLTQVFEGVGWGHYVRTTTKSVYFNFVFGLLAFSADDFGRNDIGYAGLTELGYQFDRHFQIGAFLLVGKTEDNGIPYHHTQAGVLLTYLKY